MKKFWNWIHDDSGGWVLRLEGPIDEESFWGDEITPADFRAELEAEEGDVTVWINSPGGNVFAAAEIGDFLHAMAKRELCPYGLGWYPYFRMTDHILLFSDLSAEQQDRVEAFALRVLNSRQMNLHSLYQVFWKNSSHSDIVNPL